MSHVCTKLLETEVRIIRLYYTVSFLMALYRVEKFNSETFQTYCTKYYLKII